MSNIDITSLVTAITALVAAIGNIVAMFRVNQKVNAANAATPPKTPTGN